MRYGRINENGRPEFVDKLYIDGNLVVNPKFQMWLSQGLKPIIAERPPNATSEFRYEFDKCIEKEKSIIVVWKKVKRNPTPKKPRVFSKFELEGKLFQEGLMDQVDAIINSQVITNDQGQTMPLRRRYDTALVFSESHPDFARVLTSIKQALGISDEKVEEILAASVEKDAAS